MWKKEGFWEEMDEEGSKGGGQMRTKCGGIRCEAMRVQPLVPYAP